MSISLTECETIINYLVHNEIIEKDNITAEQLQIFVQEFLKYCNREFLKNVTIMDIKNKYLF